MALGDALSSTQSWAANNDLKRLAPHVNKHMIIKEFFSNEEHLNGNYKSNSIY